MKFGYSCLEIWMHKDRRDLLKYEFERKCKQNSVCVFYYEKKKGLTTWQQPWRISWERIIIIRIQIFKKNLKKVNNTIAHLMRHRLLEQCLILLFLLCSVKFFCSGHPNCFFNLVIWKLNLIIYFNLFFIIILRY